MQHDVAGKEILELFVGQNCIRSCAGCNDLNILVHFSRKYIEYMYTVYAKHKKEVRYHTDDLKADKRRTFWVLWPSYQNFYNVDKTHSNNECTVYARAVTTSHFPK